MKLLILSNFNFFHNVFLKHFTSMCLKDYIGRKGLILRSFVCCRARRMNCCHNVTLVYVRAFVLCFLFCLLAHLSTECSVSYCYHSPSVVVRPSVHNLLVNTLVSTNINQSSPNLVKMYMTIRPRMSSIMNLIGPELSELSALEFENLPYLTLFTL